MAESQVSVEAIAYLVNHVILPPKLPQADDYHPANEIVLIETIRQALQEFQDLTGSPQVASAIATISNLLKSRGVNGIISDRQLSSLLAGLATGATRGAIPLEVKEQNAGIYISRRANDIIFETFELSPKNKSVYGTNGRLVRSFPAAASMLSLTKFQEEGVQGALAHTIAKMSSQTAPGFQPQVQKANKMHDETRDTTHPGLVTNYLINVIVALGQPIAASGITKNTREEVLWSDSYHPWRRSPLWLLLRVSLQLHFTRSAKDTVSHENLYKPFMIYFTSKILHLARGCSSTVKSDLLSAILAKISRRLLKLESQSPRHLSISTWLNAVQRTMYNTHEFMKQTWSDNKPKLQPSSIPVTLEGLLPASDLDMRIGELDSFIDGIAKRTSELATFSFQPGSPLPNYGAHVLPRDFRTDGAYRYYKLAGVEQWVQDHLEPWLSQHIGQTNTCEDLSGLLRAYYLFAKDAYTGIPAGLSLMYLTILELWVACDRSATQIHGLILDFDPEIETTLLQSLLLPHKHQLVRLGRIEEYVQHRRNTAANGSSSLFRDFGHSRSFSVQYFDQSVAHQDLLSQISQQATKERKQKCEELADVQQKYRDLMDQSNRVDCEFYEVVNSRTGISDSHHSSSCGKCRLSNEAASLTIDIFEWPLPSNQITAKATVFELTPPMVFIIWRDLTFFLSLDVFGCKPSSIQKARAYFKLNHQYSGLSRYCGHHSNQRITILSQVKPHAATHRRTVPIPNLRQADVCLENGLQFTYYDEDRDVFTSTLTLTDHILESCTYQIPQRSASLQKYLVRPPSNPDGVSPNEVIANVSDCPMHISLDEYKAFGVLPAGAALQYLNILKELAMPALDFAKVETQCLILQTIHQVGAPSFPKGVPERVNHQILVEHSFSHVMLDQLERAIVRVTDNWESWRALASFVQLACKLLTFASSSDTAERCLNYLASARNTSFKWLKLLKDRAYVSADDEQRTELHSRAVEIALTCMSTFDMDSKHVDATLVDPSATSQLLQCYIVVHDHKDYVTSDHQSLYLAMVCSWRFLAHRMLPSLKCILSKKSEGLDQAVTASWSSFRPTNSWRILDSPHNHWLETESWSMPGTTARSLPVHFNLLTGDLLVNGLPLSRLPQKYTCHPMYPVLFGKQSLEAMPTSVPGLELSAKNVHRGHELYFGMEGSVLLLQTVNDGSHYDLLTSQIPNDMFPTAFYRDFVHWYDHQKNEVQFRERTDPWSMSSLQWRLTKVGSFWRLVDSQNTLVNMRSTTASVISECLLPLELPGHIHIRFSSHSDSLEIDLPRLRLNFSFTTRTSQIYSKQHRGMTLDVDQDIGTLHGLQSKLVLRRGTESADRLVLIPEGKVQYAKTSNHVNVSVEKDTTVRIQVYQIEGILGRLMDNGSLQSKLYLCYLHALTSHCLPDTLTRLTGTEAALSILSSAAVRSFDVLTRNNINTLNLIASLAPRRSYYPQNLRVMQKVTWDTHLSFLSQDSNFYSAIESLFMQARGGKFFHAASVYTEPSQLNFVDQDLLKRDQLRSSVFRVSGFGAERYSVQHDTTYSSRDHDQDSDRGRRSYVAAALILKDEAILASHLSTEIFRSLQHKYLMNKAVKGPGPILDSNSLKFDTEWLQEPSKFLPAKWCSLHLSLAGSSHKYNRFDIMMWASTLAFADKADMEVVQTLAAFCQSREFASIEIPSAACFDLSKGDKAEVAVIRSVVSSTVRAFQNCPEAHLSKQNGESKKNFERRRYSQFQTNQTFAVNTFVDALQRQWPCDAPSTPNSQNAATYFDPSKAMADVRINFRAWHDNLCFSRYLERVGSMLARQKFAAVSKPRTPTATFEHPALGSVRYLSKKDIFAPDAPTVLPKSPRDVSLPLQEDPTMMVSENATNRLAGLSQALLVQTWSKYEIEYVGDLRQSFLALQGSTIPSWSINVDDNTIAMLKSHLGDCYQYFEQMTIRMEAVLNETDQISVKIAAFLQHSPRVPPAFWLSQLNGELFQQLSPEWRAVIIKYGLAVTHLHRAQRLVALAGKPLDLAEEFRNRGHQNWDPAAYPESLLLEAESGIMIRDVQELIACQMRNPPDRKNAVMQLNMGEGKSSVIVPIVAAALADGTKLTRVIVAKPQSRQMFQMLVAKLGGLLNRRIYHMPFSRALKLTKEQADIIGDIYHECIATRGILLVQPEHILSFKLMGIECLLTDRESLGRSLLATQQFFDTKSRDIVDESDENFSVKFELIYTMGVQGPIELSPERWNMAHAVLGLVLRYSFDVKRALPASIELDDRWEGRFPRIRILRSNANEQLSHLVAKHICTNGLLGFPVSHQQQSARDAVYRYITIAQLTTEEIEAVEKGPFWTDRTKDTLLLVRGLIACGVLRFVLESKRWRVNFGVDPRRVPATKLAVPFRSKDNPSPRSEFSHPDVVIVLTSLTYYYGGLEYDELFDAFAHLQQSDQAEIEYRNWVDPVRASLKESFHQLGGVNIKDRIQCIEEVFPKLRHSKGAVDYFLSHVVFPKELKEFPHKLSASGWDIGEVKSHPTTGFSGTNDSSRVLPLSIQHLDLPTQRHTNALVLAYLLQEENSVELLPARSKSAQSDADHLLSFVSKMLPQTRVILDVGAQILELNNLQVAQKWLSISPAGKTEAVVFFNDDEELSVLDRAGRVESLQVSPYAKQLDACLIYLDEAHTRGTDLKLPRNYRAAVTLGANLTKDRLVQACMRMRKLGKGQSVVFCMSEEIRMRIQSRKSGPEFSTIGVVDVLSWAISETWLDLRRSVPLWATQGRRYEDHQDLLCGASTTKEQAQEFLEDEAQPLECRYRPISDLKKRNTRLDGWDTGNTNIAQILQRCQDFETVDFNSATLQEEQERELAPEIEEERQVQRPNPMQPARHRVHPDLLMLVKSGQLPPNSEAVMPAFMALSSTSAAVGFDLTQFPAGLLVTADFALTLNRPSFMTYVSDSYQRPVQWIVSVPSQQNPLHGSRGTDQQSIILSPFEANKLLPMIHSSSMVTLHLYSPRPNMNSKSLDTLDLYTIGRPFVPGSVPRSLIVQLNLFSGQLYFNSFQEYKELCDYLGLAWAPATTDHVAADGFLGAGKGKWSLKTSPVKFLKELATKIRRDCSGIEKTHLGRMLDGALLEKADFVTSTRHSAHGNSLSQPLPMEGFAQPQAVESSEDHNADMSDDDFEIRYRY
ncbi:hypothetical protein BDV95DRAFT_611492 [Massariosphaeria phaeospora]|uniref:ubiquitinyl hydrolase 1 n=1 Tax=Massariosphaeria phaeospora TaxID=100035 RepID=A0A7C8M3U4_9PLEO|nr:hypothetical protein BDV95DRAFT_611492 [Massariosphaeria phaeospora]